MTDRSEESLSSRIVRIETRIGFCDEILAKILAGQEKAGVVGERLANHLDESQAIKSSLDAMDLRIRLLEQSNTEICAVCSSVRKAAWLIASGGVVVIWWLIQKWLEKHV